MSRIPFFSIFNAPVVLATPATTFFRSPVTFLLSAARADQFPKPLKAGSIAFAGRSNVGKSSLLNALFHSKKLARVSSTPGRTQLLNFFLPTPNASSKDPFHGKKTKVSHVCQKEKTLKRSSGSSWLRLCCDIAQSRPSRLAGFNDAPFSAVCL